MQYPGLYPPGWPCIPSYRAYAGCLVFVGIRETRRLRLALNSSLPFIVTPGRVLV